MAGNPYNLSPGGMSLYTDLENIFGPGKVIVTSGGRSHQHNINVGGSSTSQHVGGNALDFKVPGMTSIEVAQAVGSSGISYGQLIGYSNSGHAHIGVGSKREDLLKKGSSYIKTTWKKATDGALGKAAEIGIKKAIGAVIPGGEIVADVIGIGGDSCGIICQIQKWFDEKQILQRIGLVILALVLIAAAFFLLGSGQIQKLIPTGKA